MSVKSITADTFESEVLDFEGTVLVDFWASWCGPCRMLAPVIEELAESETDKKFCKVNVDDESELASAFRVMSIPTLVVMKNGEIADTHIGLAAKSKILTMLENA